MSYEINFYERIASLSTISKQPRRNLNKKPWIAVFDLNVIKNSPAGSCVLAEVLGLAEKFDITVFSNKFDNDGTGNVSWVRIPIPTKLGFLSYIYFTFLAPRALRKHIEQRGCLPAIIQATQGQYIGSDICYAHFCHRFYLNNQWKLQNARGLRRLARWMAHYYNSITELKSFRKARVIITPSQGLLRELVATYPFLKNKIHVISNPVDIQSFTRPKTFDRGPLLEKFGLPENGFILCFSALGDFSRKGLDILLESLARINDQSVCLLVVGGNAGEISEFSALARHFGVAHRVVFTGFQKDIRSYFWASNLFVLPSSYETFALVAIQAMAASLPVIVTRLHGVEEYVEHSKNGWLIERNTKSLVECLQMAMAKKLQLQKMGEFALKSAKLYDTSYFIERWHSVIDTTIKLNSYNK